MRQVEMEVCRICNKEFSVYSSLSKHIKKNHCSIQEYYEEFILEDQSRKFCPICGERNIFYKWYRDGRSPYSKTCCKKECRYKQVENTVMQNFGCTNVFQSEIIKEQIKIDRFERTGYEYSSQIPEVKKSKELRSMDRYGVINPFQAEECKQTSRETMMSNWGVEHALQSPILYKKFEDTNFERYGATHYMKTKEGIEYLQSVFLGKYGETTPFKVESCKIKQEETMIKNYGVKNGRLIYGTSYSKVSQELFWSVYNQLPLKLQNECYFATFGKEFVKHDSKNKTSYFYDFTLSHLKFIIEFDGKYWHTLETEKRDSQKQKFIEDLGFTVLRIKEEDFYKNKKEVIKTCLLFINNFYLIKQGDTNETKYFES